MRSQSVKSGFFLLAVLILGTGCANHSEEKAYPASAVEAPPSLERNYAEVQQAPFTTVRVFYGTNRAADPRADGWNDYYSSSLGTLEIGRCEVSIPSGHEYGEVERPSIWKLEFFERADHHVVLQKITPQSPDQFVGELQRDVAESQQKEAFVFVHGFNVTFAEAARRTAQMAYDLKFDGPPLFYSWPSRGSLAGYSSDIAAAEASVVQLQQFLEGVAFQSGATEIHLIAHSMGNRVLTQALNQIALAGEQRPVPRFNEILLAAPDIDANSFRNEIAPRIVNSADRITIYASSNDKALILSQKFHEATRLGQGGSALTLFPEFKLIDVVDSSGIDFDFFELGHSAYGRELLHDVRQTLDGATAEKRSLARHPSGLAWVVPNGSIVTPVGYETLNDEPDFDAESETKPPGTGFWNWLGSLWPW